MRISGLGFVIGGVSGASLVALRCVGVVKIAIIAAVVSLTVKISLNWILIFGNLGAPAMEIEGAATASVVSRIVEFTIVSVYVFKIDNKIKFRLRYFLISNAVLLRDCARHGGPVFINELLWGLGAATIAIIIGQMGTEFTAANSITVSLGHFVSIVGFSMGFAAAALIGNTVGAGEYDKARIYGSTITIISIIIGVVSCLLMLVLKYPVLSLYNVSEQTLAYAGYFINIHAVIVIFQCIVMAVLVGLQRGGGDTRFAMVVDVIFMWAISIPVSFVGGLKLGWAAPLVYFILRGDEILKTIVSLLRIRSGKWIKNITQTEA